MPTSKTPKIHNQAVKSILELVINSTYLYTTVPTNKTISGMFAWQCLHLRKTQEYLSHQANSEGRKQQPNAVNNVVKRLSMSHFCKILPTINTRSGGVTRQYLTFPKST